MTDLSQVLEAIDAPGDGPWRIEREPHTYNDGTTHFIHVVYTTHDIEGEPMQVMIGQYLTGELAQFLVQIKAAAPALLAAAKERDALKSALAEALEVIEFIAEEHDAGRHDGKPEPCPAHSDMEMWLRARDFRDKHGGDGVDNL